MKRFTLLLLCITLMGMQFAFGQTRRITGTVKGSADNLPVPGASIVVKGTTVGTVTNMEGIFSLDVPQNATTLVFSFIGMKSVEVPISGTTMNITMEQETYGIDEVIAVAYGTVKKGSFTGAAVQIGSEKITARPVTNISKAIEGATSGVQVSAASGQPGSC